MTGQQRVGDAIIKFRIKLPVVLSLAALSFAFVVSFIVAVSSHAASAKEVNKASSTLLKQTATGKHYNNVVLSPNKSKTPVAKKPATNTAADKTTKPVLKLDGIKGESKDDKHKDQIEIQ